jgi:predicted metal-binding membrane protein
MKAQEAAFERRTALESALRRERMIVASGLAGATAVSWLCLVRTSLDMYGLMDGPSAWMMAASWDVPYFLLVFLMWCVMMLGMMLPSAAPTILLFAHTVRSSSQAQAPIARTYAFAVGYLVAWTGFSLAATTLQRLLAEAALISPMMEVTSPTLGAVILIAVGVYQWTCFKRMCLTRCRSPLQWLSRRWRLGVVGAIRMGVSHGLYCVGCCWAVMLLLFFGGIMNLLWIAPIAVFVLLEKLMPQGAHVDRLGGVLLLAAGLWLLV